MAFRDAVLLRIALRRDPPFFIDSLITAAVPVGDFVCEATKSEPMSGTTDLDLIGVVTASGTLTALFLL